MISGRSTAGLTATTSLEAICMCADRCRHDAQVCGLKWSPDDRQLASGGNDNQLYCWSASSSQPVLRFDDHQVLTAPCKVDGT